jgi:hypothetical protein
MSVSKVALASLLAVSSCTGCGGTTAEGDRPKAGDTPPGTPPTFADLVRQGPGGGGEIQCFPRQLNVDETGTIPCSVLEDQPAGDSNCDDPGRLQASSAQVAAAREVMAENGLCGGSSNRSCADICYCAIEQLVDFLAEQCRTDPASLAPGFCYIDLEQGLGDVTMVEWCPATQKRLIRFSGEGIPRNGAAIVIACFE